MSNLPIADHALLSDCRSAALVSRRGSVEWLCLPRFDAPSVFGRILDEDAGHWSIRPTGETEATRRYVDETMLLETTLRTSSGVVRLVDALAVGRNERGHELGAGAPSALLRQVTGVEGVVELELEYAPRPEYGLVYPVLEAVDGGVWARGGASVLALSLAPRAGDRRLHGPRPFHRARGRDVRVRAAPRHHLGPPAPHVV